MTFRSARYRSEMKILADILRVVEEEGKAKPTRILYKANLSYERLNRYLERLKAAGLILEGEDEARSRYYVITREGEAFLREYEKFERFAEAFGFLL